MKNKWIVVFVSMVITLAGVFVLNKDKIIPGRNFKRYNVIMIVSDALRRDVLGCYHGDVKTPNIDWLAQQGLLFENAYSTAPCTMPSSVSIATGNYSTTYTVVVDKKWKRNPRFKLTYYVNNNETLLPKRLREIGYDVKMDVENETALRSNNFQGFDQFREIGQMSKEKITFVENAVGIQNINSNQDPLISSKYHRLYDLLYYLLTVPEDQRFFLLKWFYDPHAPYNPPKKFKEKILVDPTKLSKKISFYSTSIIAEFNRTAREKELSSYDYYYIKELYKAEVESVDERVGYIIKALSLKGLLDKTIIVFTSDHGELFGEHDGGRLGHGGGYWEELVHVPLIIFGPGIQKSNRVNSFLSLLDLMPTLKEYLGLRYKNNPAGKSYGPLLSGAAGKDRVLYFDKDKQDLIFERDNDALLMDNYKLIVYRRKKGNHFKLFQIAEDPAETTDLSKGKRIIVGKMLKEISNIKQDINQRLKQNLKALKRNIDLNKEREKTIKILKSLGYLK